ncbi:MAG TPA: CpsD/CapB family tyrosine-protein kinase, partial [Segetibacter sp.]
LSPIFNISNNVGISNYIIGKTTEEQIIKKTAVNDNLYFISAGPIPPNPSELILNDKLQFLLESLKQRFDYIIIDTAPVSPVTDAYILSKFCDTTLFIVRHAYTPKMILSRIVQSSQVRVLHNAGIIFNGVKARGFGKGSYGYGYGYGYSYGYGYGVDEKK